MCRLVVAVALRRPLLVAMTLLPCAPAKAITYTQNSNLVSDLAGSGSNGPTVDLFQQPGDFYTNEIVSVVLAGPRPLYGFGDGFQQPGDSYSNEIVSVVLATESPIATPIPAALPLFAGGLGLIGLLAGRSKRKDKFLAAP